MQVNATTRNCPEKMKDLKISNKENFERLCVWSKNITINYSKTPFVGGGRASNIFLVLLFIVLLLLSCVCLIYKRNKSIQNEYERLKREIGSHKPTAEADYFKGQPDLGDPSSRELKSTIKNKDLNNEDEQ